MSKLGLALTALILSLAAGFALAQNAVPPLAAASAPLLEDAASARDTAMTFCDSIEKLKKSGQGDSVSPADKKRIALQAGEALRRSGISCGSSSASVAVKQLDNSGVLAQLRLDLQQAREVIATRAAEKVQPPQGRISATGDKLIDCETKSRVLFVGNDGQMFATCAGTNDTVFRAPPPPAPQVIVVQQPVVHQLGAPMPAAQATAQAAAAATGAQATAQATASASANASPVPGNLSGRGTVRYQNPVTGKLETGEVNSPTEALAWLLERQKACTAELRKQPGANADATCSAPQKM